MRFGQTLHEAVDTGRSHDREWRGARRSEPVPEREQEGCHVADVIGVEVRQRYVGDLAPGYVVAVEADRVAGAKRRTRPAD